MQERLAQHEEPDHRRMRHRGLDVGVPYGWTCHYNPSAGGFRPTSLRGAGEFVVVDMALVPAQVPQQVNEE